MAPVKTRDPTANVAHTATENKDKPEIASIAVENAFVVVHNPEIDYYLFTGVFVADSGASIHLFNDINMLINPTN
jgi:hypothetical protein